MPQIVFRIVFAPMIALPVTFTNVKAYGMGKNINVEWKVENEVNIKKYEVERSEERATDLRKFIPRWREVLTQEPTYWADTTYCRCLNFTGLKAWM